MELPPYRMPTLRNTTIHMWHKGSQYLTKMGTVILLASILIWAMGYYPRNVKFSEDYDVILAQTEADATLSDDQKIERTEQIKLAKEEETPGEIVHRYDWPFY